MKTWLITGCSSGLGRQLAEAVAARGDRLVATARSADDLQSLCDRYPDTVRSVSLDVTRAGDTARAVDLAESAFGGLDVLVNNAGFGFIGAIEEGEPAEYRPLFEVNVFGLIETTRAALPALRRRPGARIVNLSSGAGIAGSAGFGFYNATKFAVEGLSEALAGELRPLGVDVIIAEPGPFRTAFLGRSMAAAAREIPAYAGTTQARRHYRQTNDGRQAGDPAKAVAVMLQAVDAENPPLHLPIGPRAHAMAERKLDAFRADMAAWRDISIATDFDTHG
ncbi:oxidoreductase [Ancylobacter pratisalsi]|uniref:SDR family NAD(P)-dependent oxidoreductase n=1 Tax=Ancylobacter pratisalsi TaxID=1745854 RepID=A0A6P1YG43_9HYPH|nr:oxidoreductase [Ancylobacter pratisalsi]QIB32288.1 SDR family NAD(P)-dependent oxidoreductase [Ancylobacter pratisalsi]